MAERQTPKVKGKQIDSGLAQDEEQKPVIDISLLDMLKSLDLSHYGESFAERLATFSQKIGANLRALRDTLYQRDCSRIENIACELSNHALMVGATRMMQSSYELQSAARLGDLTVVQKIADQLEMEFVWVQQGLAKAASDQG